MLAREATALGLVIRGQSPGAVLADGPLPAWYRACLWSRLASAVLLEIAPLSGASADEWYAALLEIDWSGWVAPGARFAISHSGTHPGVANAMHAVFRAKDAIRDHYRRANRSLPDVDRDAPDVQLHLHLGPQGSAFYLSLSGAPLHERGYRVSGVEAPLKETLAAAVVLGVGLPEQRPAVLLDPCCGSATLLIEAVWVLADVAPGLMRRRWGFERWPGHCATDWNALLREAEQRRATGLAARLPRVAGHDADPDALRAARACVAAAGLTKHVHLERRDIAELTALGSEGGLLLANPPYGERLSSVDAARFLYRCLGRRLRARCAGWRAAILAGSIEHLDELRVADYAQLRLRNGPLTMFLRVVTVPDRPDPEWPALRVRSEVQVGDEARPLANRLLKNWKQLRPDKAGWRAFRLYDADLPEFNVAVDLYGDRVHVQEYAAPATVDADKAAHRLQVALEAIAAVTGRRRDDIVLKVRSRQKGRQQYERRDERGQLFEVEEQGARLLVNLEEYLDTGLFLDHRPMRIRLQELCRDRHFLNLFCYTGSATVHAAIGGARSSLSVDLNPRYLDWAEANLALNGYSTHRHRLVRADVLAWLDRGGDQFDVIFMDPPTFSNSKRSPNVLDVQRDQVEMVQGAMRHLARDGVLVFSNNYRRFQLEESISRDFDVRDITAATIPADFARNPRIHACWEIRHRG